MFVSTHTPTYVPVLTGYESADLIFVSFFSTNVLLGSIFLHMKARKLWQNFAYMATFLFGQLYCSKGIFIWSGFYRLNVPGAVVACRCLITMYRKLTLGQTFRCGFPY